MGNLRNSRFRFLRETLRKPFEKIRMMRKESASGFKLTIVEAKRGASVEIGVKSPSLFVPAVIGRGDDVDFEIADASVSRRHVQVTPLENEFLVESLSKNGTTFINGDPLDFGEHRLVAANDAWLQLGRVLVRAEFLTETIPVSAAIPIPNPDAPSFALIMVREGPDPEVWLGGTPTALFPQAARMLRALCEQPMTVLTYDEIGRASNPDGYLDAGGNNYAQLATYIRNAFVDAFQSGVLDRGDFSSTDDPREVARHLVRNVRSVGYILDTSNAGVLRRDDPPPRQQ